MDWEDKSYVQRGRFIGRAIALFSIFCTFIIFSLVKIQGEIYMNTFSPLALLTFPTGYILFFLQGIVGESWASSDIHLLFLFIVSSIITWILLTYAGSFIGRRIEKSKPREQGFPSPHDFDWRNA